MASAPVVEPSAPVEAASQAATSVATVASVASEPKPAASVPGIPAAVPQPEAAQPSLLESLNPMLLAAGGAGLALLAGVGMFLRSRRRSDTGETSFLESRLQPDSFFGASGGQRVDTRDASGGPSSMSYSLSQLDAIGDVDPVAEADVYLAYGRDLQAEEILKEALRSTPDRLAVRVKLLEVYAKRRDTKGFEQLAVQLYDLTGGHGEDWTKAQEMGLGIDPENPLYQPGGQPSAEPLNVNQPHDPLGASTLPASVVPAFAQLDTLPETAPAAAVAAEHVDVADLDSIDLDISAPMPLDDAAQASSDVDLPVLDVPGTEPAPLPVEEAPLPPVDDGGLDFDLSLDEPAAAPVAAPAPAASSDFGLSSIDLTMDAPGAPVDSGFSLDEDLLGGKAPDLPPPEDPMERKFELAEEFRQIGDLDGARELLQEVVANADGGLQAKAQAMLDSLS